MFRLLVIGICLLGFMLGGCGEDTLVLTTISVSPSAATVAINGSLQFYATGYDQNGNILTADFTWSTSIGTISTSGKLYAPSSSTSGSVTATARGISGSATVTVTDKGTISGRLVNSEGTAVSSMLVYVKGSSTLNDYSDASGDYSILNVPPGTQEVITSENVLYLPTSAEVTVTTAETATANITLTDRLAVENENISGDTITTITGQVRNNGTTEAQGVRIIYVFYKEDGSMAGSTDREAGYLGDIAAGATHDFYLSLSIGDYASKERIVSATSY